MNRIFDGLTWFVIGLIVFLAAVAGAQPPRYRFVDLGAVQPRSINKSVAMAGEITSGAVTHAIWQQGFTTVDLGTLGGTNSAAMALNKFNSVVGQAEDAAGVVHGFIWTSTSGMQPLPDPLNATWTTAYSINNLGQSVGWAFANGRVVALRWDHSQVTELPHPGTNAWAISINALGNIGGDLDDEVVIWQPDGTITHLGTFGGVQANTIQLNNYGVVLLTVVYSDGTVANILSQNGQAVTLNPLPNALECAGHSLNNYTWSVGQCVMQSNTDPLPDVAVLWAGTQTAIDLNTLVDNASGWTFTNALGLNDRNMIVATGRFNGEEHGVVLIPKPQATIVGGNR
jgi:hypothetical protein